MNTSQPLGLSARSFFAFVTVVMLVGVPGVARADLPRPAGWEPTCTIEKEQKKGGGPCEECRGWNDPDPCQKALETKGFVRHCTEGGAGSFVAVWCKGPEGAPIATTATNTPAAPATTNTATTPAAPPTVAPAPDNRRGGGMCSVSGIGQDKRDGFLLSLLPMGIAIGLLRRRRSSGQGSTN
jgi:hypothetical protein